MRRQVYDGGLCRYVAEETVERWQDDAEGAEVAGVAASDKGVQPDRPADAGADGGSL